MKTLRTFKIFLFLLSCAAVVQAQVPIDEFVCGKGRFALAIIAKPTKREDVRYTLGKYELNGESIAWNAADHFIGVEYFEVYGEQEKLTGKDKAAVIQEYKKSLFDQLQKLGVMTNETSYDFEGFLGTEIKGISKSSNRLISHLFFTKSRFVAVSITNFRSDGYEPLNKVLNSFRYLTKPEYVAALISENTPPPLPQISSFKRPQNDAQDDGLRGKIHSVMTDIQEPVKATRESLSQENYDENGNQTKTIDFHRGYPSNIIQLGWIDDARVSIDKFIEYGMNEGPNENGISELVLLDSPDDEKAKKRDGRFSNRYEYKYDLSGRLARKMTYQNDGSLWTREVKTYGPGTRENVVYGEKGKLNSKTVEILGEAGNVVETRSYDFHNKLDGIKTYKYEFDQCGNWVVRRDFDKTNVGGKVVLKPSSISYRTIKYF